MGYRSRCWAVRWSVEGALQEAQLCRERRQSTLVIASLGIGSFEKISQANQRPRGCAGGWNPLNFFLLSAHAASLLCLLQIIRKDYVVTQKA